MPSFKRFYMEKRKKTIQSRKNGAKLLQLAMISCSYNFIKLSMCSYNFNVAVRISINPAQVFLRFLMLSGHKSLLKLSIGYIGTKELYFIL